MLAIQRPRMGSTQPSDLSRPFGYDIDPSQELFLDPPEPAPGAPLLSDNETKLLSSFFEDLTADHYNMPSFGEGLNFSDAWLELPPQFMGTTTSFGQSPSASALGTGHGLLTDDYTEMLTIGASMMPPPPPPPPQQQHHHHLHHPQHQPQSSSSSTAQMVQVPQMSTEQHHSADVLAAATLLQNGSGSRQAINNHAALFPSRDTSHSLGPPVGHLRHQPLEDFKRAERASSQARITTEHDSTFADMFFGSAGGERHSSSTPRASQPPSDVQWGTDARFNRSQSFVPDSSKETYDALSNDQLRYMECLEVNRSAVNTRPPTPNGDYSPKKSHSRKSSDLVQRDEQADGPPQKRRKSRNTKEDVEDEDDETRGAPKSMRKRKTKGETCAATPPAENGSASRRRKSGLGAKPPRENLTEEQKRENHIRSEQKRRTLIKEGFDDLCNLVPGLKGGGFSKSTMLSMAGDWLEELLNGNEQLKAQLAALEGR